jgi:hypothetical protein
MPGSPPIGTFYFYVKSGNFGAINNGQDIVIPDRVQISTVDPNGPIYLADAITLPAASNQQYFSATSMYAGSQSNSPSGVFTRHNFTNYAESRFGSLLVTNNYGIAGGRDQETDDDYRYRIHLKLISQSGVKNSLHKYQGMTKIPRFPSIRRLFSASREKL